MKTFLSKRYVEALRAIVAVAAFFCMPALQAGEPAELQVVDSLLKVYEQSDKGGKVGIGRKLIDIYTESNSFLEDAPKLSAKMSEDSVDLVVYYATNRFYVINAYYTEALEYNKRAMDCGSKQHPDIHATLLCDRGYCYHKTSRTSEAAQVENEAMRYCQQTGNKLQLSRAYLYLAIVNHGINDQEQAKSFILKAIETNKQLGVNQQTHNALGVASEIFCGAGEVEKGIDYGLQAVEAAEAIGFDGGVANHLAQLSYAYDRNKQYDLGLEAAERSIAIINAMNIPDRNILAVANKFKGWNLLDMGRNAEAAEALWTAVAIEQELGNTMGECYDMKAIAEALEPIDPRGAMKALRRYSAMADSIHTSQLQEALGQANADFRNDELQEENAQERRMNRIILLASIIIVLLLIATIAALWWASRQKSRTNEALKRLSQARETFFTNVTHEFRTPLTVVLGMSEKLNEDTPPTEVATAGALIHRQGEQLLSLVNQLLDLSKVSSVIGKQPTRATDVAAFTEMTVEGFREMARQQGIAVNFEAEERPMVANIVPDYLQKILNNLLGNALKFTKEGGEVNVGLSRRKGRLALTVADTGTGIDAADLPHIFEPFFQSDPESGIGSGVGLTLVKNIVDALDGTIKVESEKGKGTRFSVEVPEAREAPEAPSRPPRGWATLSSGIQTETQVPPRGGREGAEGAPVDSVPIPSILIVEDNADVAYYISSLLSESYNVSIAEDGQQGLERARELMPDLIITDVMMPHTDGLELCRQIRSDEITNHIPVIVVTAKATEADRIRGFEAGADAYLYKPFNADELHLRVEKLLEQRRLLQEKYRRAPSLPPPVGEAGVSAEPPLNPPEGGLPCPEDMLAPPRGGREGAPSLREKAEMDFLERLRNIVYELMREGSADTDHIASALCLSPSQFRRKLNAITGTTPAQHVLNIRLEHSRQLLLQHPGWTIAEVAERCGFADQPHFTRVFRKAYGVTPGKIRQLDDGKE